MLREQPSFFNRNRDTLWMIFNLVAFAISVLCAYNTVSTVWAIFWFLSSLIQGLVILIRIVSWRYWA